MAIVLNSIQKRRIINQIESNLTGLQRDIHNNLLTWKAMAQAQAPALATLQSYITDAATQYNTRLGWITAFRADSTKRQYLLDIIASAGWVEQDVIDLVTSLQSAVTQISGADISTYTKIVNGCNTLVATIDLPLSLWPE